MVSDDSGKIRSVHVPRRPAGEMAEAPDDPGVESNSRLTAATAVVLLVLFAVEGFTILGVRRHLNIHVFVGVLLIPPVLLKIGSTGWRFTRCSRRAALSPQGPAARTTAPARPRARRPYRHAASPQEWRCSSLPLA